MVSAESLEQALEQGKKLGVTDILDLNGHSHHDSEIRVYGVWECLS